MTHATPSNVPAAVIAAPDQSVHRIARRLRIVDHPAHRKTHKEPVSYLGGLAVFSALILSFSMAFYFFKHLRLYYDDYINRDSH